MSKKRSGPITFRLYSPKVIGPICAFPWCLGLLRCRHKQRFRHRCRRRDRHHHLGALFVTNLGLGMCFVARTMGVGSGSAPAVADAGQPLAIENDNDDDDNIQPQAPTRVRRSDFTQHRRGQQCGAKEFVQ